MTTNDNDQMRPSDWMILFWIGGLLLVLTFLAFVLSYEWVITMLGGA